MADDGVTQFRKKEAITILGGFIMKKNRFLSILLSIAFLAVIAIPGLAMNGNNDGILEDSPLVPTGRMSSIMSLPMGMTGLTKQIHLVQ